jgi:hypothetical protein
VAREVEEFFFEPGKKKLWRFVGSTEEFNDKGYVSFKFHFENVLDPADEFTHDGPGVFYSEDFIEVNEMEVLAWASKKT